MVHERGSSACLKAATGYSVVTSSISLQIKRFKLRSKAYSRNDQDAKFHLLLRKYDSPKPPQKNTSVIVLSNSKKCFNHEDIVTCDG